MTLLQHRLRLLGHILGGLFAGYVTTIESYPVRGAATAVLTVAVSAYIARLHMRIPPQSTPSALKAQIGTGTL